MAALLLCYHFIALCTYKVILVLVLFVIFEGSFWFVIILVGLHRLLLLLR